VPRLPLAVLSVLSWPLCAAAQGKAPPEFPVGLDEVNLTVTVRDGAGRLIRDLRAENFEVFEDGRPQQIQVFGRATEPGQEETLALSLGLLLDTSESMREQMRLTQESAIRFLDSIPRARDLLVIFFDQDIRISRYSSENQQGLFERILDTRGAGMTALYDAICVYLSRVEDSPGRKVLVVFSDGEDSTSAVGLTQVLQLVRQSQVTIFPIAFTGSFNMGSNRYISARSVMTRLADLSGGIVFTPAGSRDLPGIYQKILEELESQYVIGFVSDNPRRDGKYRKLKVELRGLGAEGKDLRVRHRGGYSAFAPPR
jgi:Ca-activated chloride channel family protein